MRVLVHSGGCVLDWAGFVVPQYKGRSPKNVCGGGDAVNRVVIS